MKGGHYTDINVVDSMHSVGIRIAVVARNIRILVEPSNDLVSVLLSFLSGH